MRDKKAIQLLIQELENDFSYLQDGTRFLGKPLLRFEASAWWRSSFAL